MSRLARASALKFGAKMVETTAGALATLFFAQALGAGKLGQYFLALAVVNWLLILPTGVRTATAKRVSEGGSRKEVYGAGALMTFALLALSSLVVLLFADPVSNYVGAPLAGLVAAVVFGKGWFFFAVDVLRGEDRVELTSLVEGAWTVLRVAVQVGLVLGGFAVVGLLIGEVVAAVVIALGCLVFISISPRYPSPEHLRRIYSYARYSWFGNMKMMSYAWTDTIVLGFFVAPSTVGVYEISWRVSALFILLPTAIGNVIFPTVSRKASEGDYEAIERILGSVFTFAPLVAFPGAIGAIVLGDHVLSIYGEEFVGGASFLALLSVARIAESFETLSLQLLNALDYPERAFRVGVVFTAVNVVANVVLVIWIEAIGAAIATTFAMMLGAILAIKALPEEVSVSVSLRDLGAQVIGAVVMGFLVGALVWKRPPQSAIQTVIYVGSGAVIYGICVAGLSATLRQRVADAIEGIELDSQI